MHVRKVVVALTLLALTLTASAANRSTAGEPRRLTGQLLVAAPKLDDPSFAHSVIYIVAHGDGGAVGVIVNQPVKDISYGELFALMQMAHEDLDGRLSVHFGGPVEPRVGFVLHSRDMMLDDNETIAGDVAITTDPRMLEAIAAGHGPSRYLFMLGYAGWGPLQLDMEIANGDWVVIPNDSNLVFAPDPAKTWERAVVAPQPEL
jgi:putative transcriptional regulator